MTTRTFPKFKTNLFEAILALLTLLSIPLWVVYFYDVLNPAFTDPFVYFNSNQGIIAIATISLIARIIFLVYFWILAVNGYQDNKTVKTIYLGSALIIAFLQWYELYYGSTFYYGEVRDKQGLFFPFLASLMITLVIWKLDYLKSVNYNRAIKLILTLVINVGLYLLWRLVYEPWHLGQS